ncbi:MAG: sterol desaturase family protein [Candidatus Pacebacteria bacterium]|jgi:sterol desaturase/sphingolipid hydroxylase (fatty acid hydroxylase superfamily)|nr:hypothetical protein [bacterium]MDP6527370.1 sterol desaturase family protein [Candidatus Paceibacterota bacterium]MDP6659497.1 sterol desaturase family protein [Candidatus Paceibacterota bacterium]|tara:strand:- start:49293 stop:49982 length:690 start_codon:yes stop_codon:yes gene_type:complete
MDLAITVVVVFVVAQLLTLIAAAAVCTLVSVVSRKSAANKVANKAIFSDISYYWLLRPLAYIPLTVFLVVMLDSAGWTGGGLLTSAPIVVQIILLYLLFEFVAYWVHRIFHGNRLLYRFHMPHHRIKRLEWSNGRQDHFVFEILLLVVFVSLGLLLGVSPLTFVTTIIVWYILLSLSHHNVAFSYGPLGKVLLSSSAHAVHHFGCTFENSKNFGVTLTLFDRLFGTYAK